MATPAQIGIGAGALLGVSLGGYAIYAVTTSEGEIKAETFNRDDNFEKTDYKDKLLSFIKKDNLELLVVPAPNDKDDKNKKWWDFAFKNKYGENQKDADLDTIFKGIKKGFSEKDTDVDALNQACNIAYKQEKTHYKVDGTTKLLANIGAFCTKELTAFDISEPVATTYETEKTLTADYEWGVLRKEKNRKHLVKKLTTSDNDLWWEWAYHNLYKNKKNDVTTHFSSITKGYASDSSITLSKQCDESYKKEHDDLKGTDAKNKLLNEIAKYCSVNVLSPTLELPEKDTEPTKKHLLTITSGSTTYTNGVAKETSNNQKLVDPDNAENEDWWNWALRNRYKKKDTTFAVHTDFNDLSIGYSKSSNNKALNQVCKTSYSKNKTNLEADTDKLLKNIKEFCAKTKNEEISKPAS